MAPGWCRVLRTRINTAQFQRCLRRIDSLIDCNVPKNFNMLMELECPCENASMNAQGPSSFSSDKRPIKNTDHSFSPADLDVRSRAFVLA